VLNVLFAPMFFRATGMPFLCDLIGFAVLILTAWWIRKPGAITIVGLIATLINLGLGTGMQFIGFLTASVFFDVVLTIIGYGRAFRKQAYTVVIMMVLAIASAAVAGVVIGSLFMTGAPLLAKWGVAGWAGLHMFGGIIGGMIGIALVLALKKRKINVYSESLNQH
jgi:hypothetical protein